MKAMSAATCRSEFQRASGELRIDLHLRGERTVVADLRQEGCLKARFPRSASWTEVVTLNIGGGVAGGDRLRTEIDVRAGGRATFASQAAERLYRALPGDPPSQVRTSLTIQDGAAAEWLPQETILFDRCALDRQLTIELAAEGWFLGVESLVFGRAAMGEQVARGRLRDVISVRRAGRLLLHEAIRMDGAIAAHLARPAVAKGGAAVATLVQVAPDAEQGLDALRAAWTDAPAETGASAWNGMLLGRIVAADGACLRAAIVAGLTVLRAGRMLPRVWMC